MTCLIKLENVSAKFPLRETKGLSLIDSIRSVRLGGVIEKEKRKSWLTALDNINLELTDGDRLALIGHNGAGKTTLLKIMSSILPPTDGKITIHGHISALISIHLGIDTHATGYENIRYRARYMGYSEAEITAQYDDIAQFSELGEYLNLPMRSYSSGMRLRLAFAIATAFRPDVLILDEWLSAGDLQFQRKATERLKGLISDTGIFIFASHNETMQSRICNKGLVLDNGKLAFLGEVNEAIEYNKSLYKKPRQD